MQQDQQLEAPAMDPARAEYLRRTVAGLVSAAVAQMTAEPPDGSTDSSSSMAERLMMRAISPWIPRLRDMILSRVSSADPADLERWMGAGASALESILWQAPGEPLERFRIEFGPDGRPALVPVEG